MIFNRLIMRLARTLCRVAAVLLTAFSSGWVVTADEEPLWEGQKLVAMADANRPDLCAMLGMSYYYGLGIEQDIPKAIHWFTIGAEGGNDNCMCELAKIYRFGLLVPKDTKKAVSYMQQAIRAGNESAMLMLGWLYLTGDGVDQDFARAYSLFYRAARLGNGSACYMVAICHEQGLSVPADDAAAFQWLAVGAWNDDPNSMYHIAKSYACARGTSHNPAQAQYWFRKVAEQGIYEGKVALDELKLAQSVTPVPDAELASLSAQQCWEQYLHALYVGLLSEQQIAARLEKAVELGHHRAAAELAMQRFSSKNTPEQNFRYLPAVQKAADAGDSLALIALANYYNLCLNGEDADMKHVGNLILKCAERTQCSGLMISVADGYTFGAYGDMPDVVQADAWIKRSAAKGNLLAKRASAIFDVFSRSAQKIKKN